MSMAFLHVSDLHYEPDWPESKDLVCQRFLEDLAKQAQSFHDPYLLFSGDLVKQGGEPKHYEEMLKRLDTGLTNAGFPKERRFCVPGNHDVSQPALKEYVTMQLGTLGAIRDEETFNTTLPSLLKSIFASKFEPYKAHELQFAKYACCGLTLGGAGHVIDSSVGVFCLNTALCSFGGSKDTRGEPISDKGRLLIDTRSLHKWIAELEDVRFRILVMHHPVDWLADWARTELETIIAQDFNLVVCGHVHAAAGSYTSRGGKGCVQCVAPPLFTAKSDLLGYSLIKVDVDESSIEVRYRQWTPQRLFVLGTALSGSDSGALSFSTLGAPTAPPVQALSNEPSTTTAALHEAFARATTCYSSKRQVWVDRDLSHVPETASHRAKTATFEASELIAKPRTCVIRAPKQFGLTALGHYIALNHHMEQNKTSTLVLIDAGALPNHSSGAREAVLSKCAEISVSQSQLAGLIVDNWTSGQNGRRALINLQREFAGKPIILLQSLDDTSEIAGGITWEEGAALETIHLWALSRRRVRELVAAYGMHITAGVAVDEDIVTTKILQDIDGLNTHRSPLNCLLILKLFEQAFDDSPVNRTELIGRVLYMLFHQFTGIPRYATRPDLKDCEYAMGYVCEWLIRNRKWTFFKQEFFAKVTEYCKKQLLELDCDVLFAFLVSENILIGKGATYEFRFSYWMYYFAAHRMHHSPEFASYVLEDSRYAAMPEVVEFYTGIDRRRTDAIIRLTSDLSKMNDGFSKRTAIPEEFNPFVYAKWIPDAVSMERMQKSVAEGVAESTLPAAVKDMLADQHYDPGRPYKQELSRFFDDASLMQLVQTMRGAARALRNSDHVAPEAKSALLVEVIKSWGRVCQALVLIAPILAEHGVAAFEDMGFYLDETFEKIEERDKRWNAIMSVIADNVVEWYQEDISSKKMGALFGEYVKKNQESVGELLTILVLIKQRPPGWEREVEQFIVRSNRHSYYLSRVFSNLRGEFRTGFCSERNRQQLRRLAAMTVAKHATGSKRPGTKLIEKMASQLERDGMEAPSTEGEEGGTQRAEGDVEGEG